MVVKPELLAPVGSWEALVAAVQNGADAVYVGGKMFNARQFANNFDNDEMARAVDYAHIRGTKVYVTVNTLVADHELSELVPYLRFLYETGVDAIIVQDLGVVRVAAKILPELTLHASTQMTMHNSAGVNLMKEAGFKRVVLAREMALEEIKEIKQKTGVEIEIFVHGALCISYSGQCLMSSMIGGRSGNRGRCAQPCRLPYNMVDTKGQQILDPDKVGKYLLSPRDLRLLYQIPKLSEAGINSLKIEGRMKRPEYVATVTRVYRAALDRYAEAPFSFEVLPEEEKQLTQIFNRDFSAAYFTGLRGSDIMSYKRPNNRGIKIGRIAGFNRAKGQVEIQLEDELSVGDGIEVWVSEGGRQGIVVSQLFQKGNPVEKAFAGQVVTVPLKGKVRMGDRVFKTHDQELMNTAQLTFTSPKETKKLPIAVQVRAALGEPLTISVEDTDGNKALVSTNFIAVEAINQPISEEKVRKQIERMGNTPFQVGSLEIKIDGNIMVPLGEINDARRRALEILEQQRATLNKPTLVPEQNFRARVAETFAEVSVTDRVKHVSTVQVPKSLAVTVGSKKGAEAAISHGADIVYLSVEGLRPGKPVEVADLDAAADFAIKRGCKLVLATPRITKDRDIVALQPYLEKAKALNLGILAGNLGLLSLAGEMGFEEIYTDFSLNVFNHQTLLSLAEENVSRVTVSPELTLRQLAEIQKVLPTEVIVHGAIPLMVSEHCVTGSTLGNLEGNQKCSAPCGQKRYALKDRLGLSFPLVSDRFCRTHVYNPKELCLVEDLKPILDTGVTVLRLELRKDSPEYVGEVTKIYRQEIDRLLSNKGEVYTPRPDVKDRLAALTAQGVTKGHLYRGVL